MSEQPRDYYERPKPPPDPFEHEYSDTADYFVTFIAGGFMGFIAGACAAMWWLM